METRGHAWWLEKLTTSKFLGLTLTIRTLNLKESFIEIKLIVNSSIYCYRRG